MTLGIFTVITGITLSQYKNFNGTTVLTNLAYEIAITIRQAQVYGLSVKNAGGSNPFNVRYGLRFTAGNSFILFGDINNNAQYDSSPVNEAVETLRASQGNTISNFCGVRIGSAITDCVSGGTGSIISSLDIMFLRPNPDAQIKSNLGTMYQTATITVRSSVTGATKIVTVSSTGQVQVQ